MPSSDTIIDALKTVKYPGYSRDIVSFGLVKQADFEHGRLSVLVVAASAPPNIVQQLRVEIESVLGKLPGITSLNLQVQGAPAGSGPPAAPNPWGQQNKVTGVKRIVAVASGKGGVGKSTCSVNLACALQQLGLRVGLLDCDIYGPSIPLMMGVNRKPQVTEDEKLIPLNSHGVKLMSMGFLLEGDSPVIWRGPMIMKTIQQFLLRVDWGDLDVLLVDLPPGTGDAQLSLCQTVPLDGGVIVTTPQEASLGVVRKGIAMFEKVNVPILGILENMSYYMTPTGDRVEIFGHGGGKQEAARQKVPFLGEIPIFVEIREGGDSGIPVSVGAPKGSAANSFMQVARYLHAQWD